mmetsp:Transcript_49234/g.88456  ORF Transcript_49234/g.88456 Transcript_49234/m.88456 type:complete len:227 (-) Transcript_49234:217-897(-)
MKKDRMCCFSSTTSSASLRQAPRSLLYWAAFPALSVTSPPWRQTWQPCKSVLPPRRKAPSHRCKPFTCQQTISQTQPQPPHSPTWMQLRCCLVKSQSWAFTLQWTPWTPPPACWILPSWGSDTTRLHATHRRCSRTTSRFRTSSRSWAWTSSVRRTSSPWHGHVKCSASCLSHSSSQRSSQEPQVPSWIWRQPSATSRRFFQENVMPFLRLPFTWLEACPMSARRQ